jgi:hypothetical protein
MDINSVTRDYAQCISNGAITEPTGGTWVSAAAIYLGQTTPVNNSWLQALCYAVGVTQPVNSSWVIALATHYGIGAPENGSWWYAIADEACNGVPAAPCTWGGNQNQYGVETRQWGSTSPCGAPPVQVLWEGASDNWESEPDNWESI